MKFNWGTGIVIAIVCFMGFILFFIIKVQSNSLYDNELVVAEYYKQERGLDAELESEQNAAGLVHNVTIENTATDIKITFPEGFDYKQITGQVSLYRPSSQKLDFEIPVSLSGSYMLIPKSELAGGRWDITLDWNYNGKAYRTKEMFNF
ncbi:cytochrome C oxidase Cbb3 [Flavobacterium akiainvivens]|uniref:Cytochrome C oxidase Cbb3 n=1 Tax=Flavobacterium akiainvivens TaxID=1202724 RepID=A0A0M8MG84_9FLAO|nr:FixH family protein [Flavobacterium akiainvivens]KOS08234.1 cytochrome C oxidase Cbb3 [Flavobacterium akiainvivens]